MDVNLETQNRNNLYAFNCLISSDSNVVRLIADYRKAVREDYYKYKSKNFIYVYMIAVLINLAASAGVFSMYKDIEIPGWQIWLEPLILWIPYVFFARYLSISNSVDSEQEPEKDNKIKNALVLGGLSLLAFIIFPVYSAIGVLAVSIFVFVDCVKIAKKAKASYDARNNLYDFVKSKEPLNPYDVIDWREDDFNETFNESVEFVLKNRSVAKRVQQLEGFYFKMPLDIKAVEKRLLENENSPGVVLNYLNKKGKVFNKYQPFENLARAHIEKDLEELNLWFNYFGDYLFFANQSEVDLNFMDDEKVAMILNQIAVMVIYKTASIVYKEENGNFDESLILLFEQEVDILGDMVKHIKYESSMKSIENN